MVAQEEIIMLPEVAFARVALRLSSGVARSALPDAPTVDVAPHRERVRRRAAITLHRLADWLQPA